MTAPVASRRRRPLPIFPSLGGYDRPWLRGDLIAGLTVWAVLVPEALAYASIAGVSPVVGLYAAPAGARPLRRLRQLAPPRRRADVGDRRALGRGRRRPDHRRPRRRPRLHRRAGPHDRRHRPRSPDCCASGFLANFISEPVLKGFIIGLALTIIIGQVPKLLGIEKAGRQLLRAALGRHHAPRRHPGPDARRRPRCRSSSCSPCGGTRRSCPARSSPSSSASSPSSCSTSPTRVSRSSARSTAGCRRSGCPTGGRLRRLPGRGRLGGGDHARRVRRGPRRGQDVRRPRALRDRRQPRAARSRRGQPRQPGCAAGMVVNGSLSKTAVNGSAGARSQVSGLVVAVLTVVTLLFLTGLFENLPEATLAAVVIAAVVELVDIGALRGFYGLYTAAPRADLRHGGPPGLHRRRRRDARRAAVRHAARAGHRHRRVAAPAAVPGLEAARRRARSRRRDGRPVQRPRAPPGQRGGPRRRRAARRGRAVLRQRRRRARRRSSSTPPGPASAASSSTPRRSRSSTSPPCACSTSSPTTSHRNGQQLVLAHDLGQVGDLLARQAGHRDPGAAHDRRGRSPPIDTDGAGGAA